MNTAPLLWASLSAATAAPIVPPDTVQQTLDNGLRVVILPMPSELVALQIWVSVGSRHEVLPGTTGYAHFFEHLMFRGSEAYTAADREAKMLSLSAVDNAWTSSDNTCYHALAPAGSLPALLDLEADRFQRLALTPASVEQESGAVMGEFRKGASSPGSRLYETLYATAFTDHTYHHTTIGLEEDVLAMADGYEAAQGFYDAYYRPERATVVIAGGVDPQAALQLVTERFGDWASPFEEPVLPVEPVQTAPRRVHIDWDGGATQPRLLIGWKGPAFVPGSTDSAALAIVEAMLSSRTAPLRRTLIEEDELAWSMWSEAPYAVDPGLMTVSVRLRDGVGFERIEAEIDAAVAALRSVDADALAVTKAWARRQLLLSLDSPESWASSLGWYAANGWGPEGIEAHLDAMVAVTAEDIRRAIDTWIVSEHKTVVTLSAGESP